MSVASLAMSSNCYCRNSAVANRAFEPTRNGWTLQAHFILGLPRPPAARGSTSTLDIMSEFLPYHTEVLGLLDELASLNQHIGPDELIALWFDALYFPAQSYVNAEGQAEWASCFSSSELGVLAKFNTVFDSLADELPRGHGWERSTNWLKVSDAAATALKEIKSDV